MDYIAESKDGSARTNEQELVNRDNILQANAEAEAKLHELAGRESDSCRSEFIDDPLTLEQLQQLRGKLLKPFVIARLCTCSKDKVTTTVGKTRMCSQ